MKLDQRILIGQSFGSHSSRQLFVEWFLVNNERQNLVDQIEQLVSIDCEFHLKRRSLDMVRRLYLPMRDQADI